MMADSIPSTSLVPIQPVFTDAERLALAGYLAGYRGLTRDAYTLDLRQFTGWCRSRSLPLFSVRRADIETFARELEARGRARATVTRRLSTIAGFYKYAVEEELLDHSPAAHVRRPRLDYESHATALDRNEVGALLVAAGLGPAAEHALISLLALNGLRISEATGAPTSSTWAWNAATAPSSSPERAAKSSPSRSLRAPPVPSTWPSASAPAGHCSSPPTDDAWTGTAPPGSSAASPAALGSPSTSARTPSGMRSSPPPSFDAGVPLRDVQEAASHADPRTPMRYDRARTSLDRHATYIVATYIAGAAR
jgi:integrase/recombinase XerD